MFNKGPNTPTNELTKTYKEFNTPNFPVTKLRAYLYLYEKDCATHNSCLSKSCAYSSKTRITRS